MTMSSSGLGSLQRSSATGTPDLHHISARHLPPGSASSRTYQQPFTHRLMGCQNRRTNRSSSIYCKAGFFCGAQGLDTMAIVGISHTQQSKNTTMGLSPNQILLGYDVTLNHGDMPLTLNKLAKEQHHIMMEQRVQAIEAINQTAEKAGKPVAQYTMGAQVWLEGKNLKLPYQSTKLAPKRYGLFKIIKEVSPMAYQVSLPVMWGIHDIFHSSLLSPYHEITQHGLNFSQPPPDLIEGEEEYKVKALCNHQCFGHSCTLQYLVKWQGYPKSDNT
jgi:hypothetical protein